MTDERVPAGAGPADRRRSTWARILLRVGLLVALLGLLAGSAWLLGPWSPDRLRGLVAPAGPLAPAVFVGLFVVLNSAGVPAPLLGAAGGLTLGLIPGALATLAGMTVAACVQFLLARRLTGPAMAAARFSGTDRLQEALQRRGWLAVVVLRLVPGPFVALNLAAGLTPLRLRWMAIGTLIGGAPKALGWAALGLGATRLAVSPLVIAAVVVAGVALTVVWLLWRRPRSSPAHAQPAAGVAEPVDLYLDSPVDPLHVACADSCPQPQGQWEGDEGDDLVRDSAVDRGSPGEHDKAAQVIADLHS